MTNYAFCCCNERSSIRELVHSFFFLFFFFFLPYRSKSSGCFLAFLFFAPRCVYVYIHRARITSSVPLVSGRKSDVTGAFLAKEKRSRVQSSLAPRQRLATVKMIYEVFTDFCQKKRRPVLFLPWHP